MAGFLVAAALVALVAATGGEGWRLLLGEGCGCGGGGGGGLGVGMLVSEVFRRKSWVMARPMEAKEREVRSQARKVRSVVTVVLVDFVGSLGLASL